MVNIAIVYIVDAFESGILALKAGESDDESPAGGITKLLSNIHNLLSTIYRNEEN